MPALPDHMLPTRCTECGSVLVEDFTDQGVVMVGEVSVAFRRHTDFVSCRNCLSLYRALDLRRGHPVPVSDEDLGVGTLAWR